jgi:ADP-ribose pyrophosphatase YjhB (NUDIX family)
VRANSGEVTSTRPGGQLNSAGRSTQLGWEVNSTRLGGRLNPPGRSTPTRETPTPPVHSATHDDRSTRRIDHATRVRQHHPTPHTAHAMRTDIVAIAVYRIDPGGNIDRVLLEERMTPALCCGGACGTIGFPGGKVETTDLGSLTRAMERELREELVFTDQGAPHLPQITGPVGRLDLGPFRISLFTTRIPPTATVRCTEEYAGRVRALHWRRPIAILTDTEPRMMPSTELLLGMVPFPPAGRRHRARAAGTKGTELPPSGRAPSTPVTKKRKRAPQVKRTQ